MAIYTKTGDKGETSLVGGTRVSKSSPRVCAYGDIDELISYLGLLRCELRDTPALRRIQENLMLGSAYVATDGSVAKLKHFQEDEIGFLEKEIDSMTSEMPPQNAFILPSSPREASLCHVARTVCRRAERSCIAVMDDRVEITLIIKYLNRLSDYLFTLGRYQCKKYNISEDFWLP